MGKFQRVESDFLSEGTRCGGWLYLPDDVVKPPVVIMANGFAAERTFRLPAFAEKFVGRGMAVFLFDFRNIGSSDGEPRNLVNILSQLRDWEAAIAHIRSLPQVNGSKIALWGYSYSGGEVIATAARDQKIAAIVVQAPYTDPISSFLRMGVRSTLPSLLAALRDLLGMITGREAYRIPVAGDPGTLAVINTPEAKSGYLSLVPEGSTWGNETPARGLLSPLAFLPPIISAKGVKCPALVILGETDSLISPWALEKTASRMKEATLIRVATGHFGICQGEIFETVAKAQADFLEKHLVKS